MSEKNDNKRVYKCDPKKHGECRHSPSCQVLCFHTFHPEYAVDGDVGITTDEHYRRTHHDLDT